MDPIICWKSTFYNEMTEFSFSQFLIQNFFFLGFESNNFEPIRFPQQVRLAFFNLLIPQFAAFEKITN